MKAYAQNILYTCNNFLSQAFLVLVPIIALDLFDNSQFVSKLGIIETIGGLIFGIITIFFIENLKKKRFLIFFSVLQLIVFLCTLSDLLEKKLYFIAILLMFILISRMIGNIQVAMMFAFYEKQGEGGIESFNSIINSIGITIGIVVAPLAVLLYKFLGFYFLILISILIIVLSSIGTVSIEKKVDEEKPEYVSIRDRLKVFFENKKISTPLFLTFGVMLSGMMVSAIYYLYVIEDLGYSNAFYTVLLTIQSVGSIFVSAYVYQKYLVKRYDLIPLLIILLAVLYFLFGFAAFNTAITMVLVFLMGGGLTACFMLLGEMFQKNCPSEVYGTINSIRITLNNTAGLIGTGLGSIIYINFGSKNVIGVSVFLFFVVAILSKKMTHYLRSTR